MPSRLKFLAVRAELGKLRLRVILIAIMGFMVGFVLTGCHPQNPENQSQSGVRSSHVSGGAPLQTRNERTPEVEIWLGKEVSTIKGRDWPTKNGEPLEEFDLPGLTSIRIHVGDKLFYETVSSISFLEERHGKVASVMLTPQRSSRHIDESIGLVRKLGNAFHKAREVELLITRWRGLSELFSRPGRVDFDDGSNVFIEIIPFYDDSGGWYLSLQFNASWYVHEIEANDGDATGCPADR